MYTIFNIYYNLLPSETIFSKKYSFRRTHCNLNFHATGIELGRYYVKLK